jgi:Flp pilus assembly pilin Flp
MMTTVGALIPSLTTCLDEGSRFSEFRLDESGSGLIEFVLIAALVSLVAIASLQNFAAKVQFLWQTVLTGFQSAI